MVFDAGNQTAEEIADEQHRPDPEHRSQHVISRVRAQWHTPKSCHDWHEGAHDRHETRNDERLAAVLHEKLMGADQVFLLEQQ